MYWLSLCWRLFLSFLVFSASTLYAATPAASGDNRKVLVLYTYSRHLPWAGRVIEGIDDALSEFDLPQRPYIFEENLDATRAGEIGDSSVWAAYLAEKYREIEMDAVMTESQQAAAFLLDYPDLFPGASRYIFHYSPSSSLGKGRGDERTYSMASNMGKALAAIKEILPDVRTVAVVNDKSSGGLARTEQLLRMAEELAASFKIEIWDEFTEEELYERASMLTPNTAIFYLPVQRDRNRKPIVPGVVSAKLAAAASVPVFSHFDSLLGTGIVGGYVVSGVQLGRLMGKIAALGGDAAPVSQEAYSEGTMGYYFDSRALSRWKIPDARLPDGSVILYREKGFFERYSGYMIAAVFLFLLETFLIAALARFSLQRKRALSLLARERVSLEKRVQERTEDLARANTNLSVEVAERKLAEEKERTSAQGKEMLFKELQHRVKNSMAIISSLVSLEKERADMTETRQALSTLGSRIGALAVLYDILYDTGGIDTIDLADYLGRVAESAAEGLGADSKHVVLHLSLGSACVGLKDAVSLGLIVNELVTDSLKYAFPDERGGGISIRLEQKESGLILEVGDDGIGLPDGFEPTRSEGFGMGLVGILAQQLGAQFSARNEGGAKFLLEMPVRAPDR